MNIFKYKKLNSVNLLKSLLLLATLSSVYADDTEIFYTESQINSNVLFVMDNSGSMKEKVPGTLLNDGDDVVVSTAISSDSDDAEEIYLNRTDRRKLYRKLRREGLSSWRTNRRINELEETNTGSSDLEMATEDSWKKLVGLRFANIQISRNAEITEAYIQFTADHNDGDVSDNSSNINIKINNINNASTFRERRRNIRGKRWSNTSVSWRPTGWMIPEERGDAQKTPDLKSLVQQVVNRRGWNPGQAMAFRISGTGRRNAQTHDHGDGSGAAVLVIKYVPEDEEKTRLRVMKDALKTVLDNAPSNLSVGIMNYGNTTDWRKNYPNGVSFPVTSIDRPARPIVEASVMYDGNVAWWLNKTIPEPVGTVTVRTFLSEIAEKWEAKGRTPIVDALYEASLYYRGKPPLFGDGSYDSYWAAHPTTYTHPDPDKVEPMIENHTISVCGGTPTNYKVWGYSSIARWDRGNGWKDCPADPNNPTGPGSPENCKDSKNSCEDIVDCDWIGTTYKESNCRNVTDEDGTHEVCDTVVDVRGHCRAGSQYNSRTCKYKVCKDKSTRNHVPAYISPAVAECQTNNIILMSDGEPETFTDSGRKLEPRAIRSIKSFMGNPGCENEPFGFISGNCGKELTHYMASNDVSPGKNGEQFINTYVVGFASGITEEADGYLKSLVTIEDDPNTASKEGYFSAQNEAELVDAFAKTLEDIAKEARSQASPGYSVNVKSGLEHENDIYIPVFDKSSGSMWAGNLKKFKLKDINHHRHIQGKTTKDIDPDMAGYKDAMTELGLFKEDAWDEWSQSEIADGRDVKKGGAASLLTDPEGRTLFTNISGSSLSSPGNKLSVDNANITEEMLFDADALDLDDEEASDHRKKLLNFIRGWKNGEYDPSLPLARRGVARKHMGDMLHSEPVVITFGAGEQYIFAATNEGYLHAFDTKTGMEKWAFMPKELLQNIESQFVRAGKHKYGVDGIISYFIVNDNHDGVISGNEKLMMYFGLRRGGKSYYALDITNPNSPKLEWEIHGGNGGAFERLGETWSAPYVANIMKDNVRTPVVIFTGGNDPRSDYGSGEDYDEDSVLADITSTSADDIYIVNAMDGSLLWSMRRDLSTEVNHAIPGGARILDTDRNGLLDRMYFSDTGGNVWRLDLDETLGPNSTLIPFAQLGNSGSDRVARKFYNEPDVSMLRANGRLYFAVSVGSGLRPHPMNQKISDHMFVLLDESPMRRLQAPFTGLPLEMNKLANVSISDGGTKSIDNSSLGGKKITDTDKKGWYVTFPESGEKVLAPSITFEGSIIFTTLAPKVETVGELINICEAPATQGRLYALNILTAEASMDLDRSGESNGGGDPENDITDNDVFISVSSNEIPSTPQTVVNKLDCSSGDCVHNFDVRVGKKSTEVSVEDGADIESVYWTAPRPR